MTDHNARQAGLTTTDCDECGYTGVNVGANCPRCGKLAAHSADARNGERVVLTDEQRKRAFDVWLDAERKRREFGVNIEEQRGFCSGFAAACALFERLAARPAAPAPTGLEHLPFPWHVSQANLGVTGATYRPVEVRAANRATVLRVGNDDSALPLANLIVAMSQQAAPAPAAPTVATTIVIQSEGKTVWAGVRHHTWDETVYVELPAPAPAAQADEIESLFWSVYGTGDDRGLRGIVKEFAQRFAARQQSATPVEPSYLADVLRQYDANGIHIGSGLPKATCPCGLCQKVRKFEATPSATPADAASEEDEEGYRNEWNPLLECYERVRVHDVQKLIAGDDAASEADKRDAERLSFLESKGKYHDFGDNDSTFSLYVPDPTYDLRKDIDAAIQRERQQGADRG